MNETKRMPGRPKALDDKRVQITITLPPDVDAALRQRSKATRYTMSYIIEDALRAFLTERDNNFTEI
ncbi:MAG: ribbon-helix-helix protein, CopG family [Armatimonadota bacterium]